MEKLKHNFTKEEMLFSIKQPAENFTWDKSDKELKWYIWQMRSRLNLLAEVLNIDEIPY